MITFFKRKPLHHKLSLLINIKKRIMAFTRCRLNKYIVVKEMEENVEKNTEIKITTHKFKPNFHKSSISEDVVQIMKEEEGLDAIKQHLDIDADISSEESSSEHKKHKLHKYTQEDDYFLLEESEVSSEESYETSEEEIKVKKRRKKSKTLEKPKIDFSSVSDDEEKYSIKDITYNLNLIFGPLNDFFNRKPNFVLPEKAMEITSLDAIEKEAEADEDKFLAKAKQEKIKETREKIFTLLNEKKTQESICERVLQTYYYAKHLDSSLLEKRIRKEVKWILSRSLTTEYKFLFTAKDNSFNVAEALKEQIFRDVFGITANEKVVSTFRSHTVRAPIAFHSFAQIDKEKLFDCLKAVLYNVIYCIEFKMVHKENIKEFYFVFSNLYGDNKLISLGKDIGEFESVVKEVFGSFSEFIKRVYQIHDTFLEFIKKYKAIKEKLKEAGIPHVSKFKLKQWISISRNILDLDYISEYIEKEEKTEAAKKYIVENSDEILESKFIIETKLKDLLTDIIDLLGSDFLIANNLFSLKTIETHLKLFTTNTSPLTDLIFNKNFAALVGETDKLEIFIEKESENLEESCSKATLESLKIKNCEKLSIPKNVRPNLKRAEIEFCHVYEKGIILQNELTRFVDSINFCEINEVREKLVKVVSKDISGNPIIRSFFTQLYLDFGKLSTFPTKKGKLEITMDSQFISVKRIEEKPISMFLSTASDKMLLILLAKKKELLNFLLHFNSLAQSAEITEENVDKFLTSQLFNIYREKVTERNDWDLLRKEIVEVAIQNLKKETERNVFHLLCKFAQERLMERFCRLFEFFYSRKVDPTLHFVNKYQKPPTGSRSSEKIQNYNYSFGETIIVTVFKNHTEKIFLCFVSTTKGLLNVVMLTSFTVSNILKNENKADRKTNLNEIVTEIESNKDLRFSIKSEDSQISFQEEKCLRDLIEAYRPECFVITTSNIETCIRNKINDIIAISCIKPTFEYVYPQIAASRAQSEFIKNKLFDFYNNLDTVPNYLLNLEPSKFKDKCLDNFYSDVANSYSLGKFYLKMNLESAGFIHGYIERLKKKQSFDSDSQRIIRSLGSVLGPSMTAYLSQVNSDCILRYLSFLCKQIIMKDKININRKEDINDYPELLIYIFHDMEINDNYLIKCKDGMGTLNSEKCKNNINSNFFLNRLGIDKLFIKALSESFHNDNFEDFLVKKVREKVFEQKKKKSEQKVTSLQNLIILIKENRDFDFLDNDLLRKSISAISLKNFNSQSDKQLISLNQKGNERLCLKEVLLVYLLKRFDFFNKFDLNVFLKYVKNKRFLINPYLDQYLCNRLSFFKLNSVTEIVPSQNPLLFTKELSSIDLIFIITVLLAILDSLFGIVRPFIESLKQEKQIEYEKDFDEKEITESKRIRGSRHTQVPERPTKTRKMAKNENIKSVSSFESLFSNYLTGKTAYLAALLVQNKEKIFNRLSSVIPVTIPEVTSTFLLNYKDLEEEYEFLFPFSNKKTNRTFEGKAAPTIQFLKASFLASVILKELPTDISYLSFIHTQLLDFVYPLLFVCEPILLNKKPKHNQFFTLLEKHSMDTLDPKVIKNFSTAQKSYLSNLKMCNRETVGKEKIFENLLLMHDIRLGMIVTARVNKIVTRDKSTGMQPVNEQSVGLPDEHKPVIECQVLENFRATIILENCRDKVLIFAGITSLEEKKARALNFIYRFCGIGSLLQAKIIGIDKTSQTLSLSTKSSDLKNPDAILKVVSARDLTKESYINLEHPEDSREKLVRNELKEKSMNQVLKTAQHRNITAFYFQNFASKEAMEEYLKARQEFFYVLRPDLTAYNKLLLNIKLATSPLLVCEFSILERNKKVSELSRIGKELELSSFEGKKEYTSLDDLVYNFVLAFNKNMADVRNLKRFRFGSEEEVHTNLIEEKKKESKTIAYAISYSYKEPGLLLLSYIFRENVNYEVIIVGSEGFIFRNKKYKHIEEVINGFKREPLRKS